MRKERPWWYRWLAAPVVIWMAAVYLAFLAGAAATLWGWPAGIELPWSDFRDFVEAKNGDIYVDVAFYGRVARYARDGRFIASSPAPGKSRHLAADVRGRLHFAAMNTVYTLDADWNVIRRAERDAGEKRTWVLDADGNAVHAPELAATRSVADELVRPGQLLFHDGQRTRERFTCAGGTVLLRSGTSLIRLAPDGRVIQRYQPPRYLWFVTFPWPGAAVGWGIPLLVLCGLRVLERRSKRRSIVESLPHSHSSAD